MALVDFYPSMQPSAVEVQNGKFFTLPIRLTKITQILSVLTHFTSPPPTTTHHTHPPHYTQPHSDSLQRSPNVATKTKLIISKLNTNIKKKLKYK